MNVKSFLKISAGMILATALNNSFAMELKCPSASMIRDVGSNFTYAYHPSDQESNTWVLLSEPYSVDEVNWQTVYTLTFPWKTMSPGEAIDSGSYMFSKSPLVSNPLLTTSPDRSVCFYTTVFLDYKVTAVSPPPFGRK